jgi:hypothetical protein
VNRLALVRTAWGVGLVAAPQLVLSLTGEDSTPSSRGVLRLLGARHAVQGTVLAARPDAAVVRLGALVDLAHASTAFGFAAVDRRWRRTALLSGVLATALGLQGLLAPALSPRRAGGSRVVPGPPSDRGQPRSPG